MLLRPFFAGRKLSIFLDRKLTNQYFLTVFALKERPEGIPYAVYFSYR
jgi:hypothetical protein